ncbi:MAG: rhomboid family intramembrane serine protease [Candidatus Paceibacterota bacterium]|jgi:membrane associated rhomboid family serine protease
MFPLYDENKRRKGRIPFVTAGLVLFNIIVFFYTFQNIDSYASVFGFYPINLFDGRFFTIFTAMFLHANLWHLLGNMLFLWVFGDNLEAKIGHMRFFLFYIFCGIIASIAYAFIGHSNSLVIGASGAISGILGGYFILFPGNKIKSIIPIIFFWTLASIPVFVFIIIWFLYQFLSLSSENMEMVAYSAHLGGFIAGLVFIKMFAKRKKFL